MDRFLRIVGRQRQQSVGDTRQRQQSSGDGSRQRQQSSDAPHDDTQDNLPKNFATSPAEPSVQASTRGVSFPESDNRACKWIPKSASAGIRHSSLDNDALSDTQDKIPETFPSSTADQSVQPSTSGFSPEEDIFPESDDGEVSWKHTSASAGIPRVGHSLDSAMTEDSWSLCTHVQPSQQDETFDEPLQELDKLMKDNAAPDINQELFCNMHKGYPTSSIIRGRVLIISNKYSSALRRGAKQDFKNLKRMFESFHFDVVGDHKDYTAQEIHDTIVNETKESIHKECGMFVLVIGSHGDDGLVYGNDDYSIKLSDISGLLSASKFRAMAGKHKMVIIDSCSGGMMDSPQSLGGSELKIPERNKVIKPPITVSNQRASSTGDTPGADNNKLSQNILDGDDMLIIQSSRPGYGSMRHRTNGSRLSRAIVITFYKYGYYKHLQELCEIVSMNNRSIIG